MRVIFVIALIAVVAVAAAGCASVSAPYVGTMTRVDQNIEKGNRGYLVGTAPAPGERKPTRQLITVDIDVSDNVPDSRIDTVAGRPGVTKSAGPGDVVRANKASMDDSASGSDKEQVIEVRREVSVVTEETPTAMKQTTVVTEEEIK